MKARVLLENGAIELEAEVIPCPCRPGASFALIPDYWLDHPYLGRIVLQQCWACGRQLWTAPPPVVAFQEPTSGPVSTPKPSSRRVRPKGSGQPARPRTGSKKAKRRKKGKQRR